eukprot:4495291-Karenia_brevis.AAC.1
MALRPAHQLGLMAMAVPPGVDPCHLAGSFAAIAATHCTAPNLALPAVALLVEVVLAELVEVVL